MVIKAKGYRLLVIVFAALLMACSEKPVLDVTVHTCAPMPSPRACATTFVMNGQAYLFAGRDANGKALNDLWRYTPQTDTWEKIGNTPLTPRVNATACVHKDKVYLGLGFNGRYDVKESYPRDWWEYTPATGQWKELASYPNHYTDCATSFADEDELYVGYGFFSAYRRDMFRYSIAEDRWDSIDVHVSFMGYPTRSFGGTGCTCQHRHFMGTGYFKKSVNWWAEFVDGTHWEERTPVPGKTRTTAASAASANYIYVSGGFHYGGVNTDGEVLSDIRRYDPREDKWQYVAILPQGLLNHISFALNGRVYFGLGETEEWKVTDQIYYVEE